MKVSDCPPPPTAAQKDVVGQDTPFKTSALTVSTTVGAPQEEPLYLRALPLEVIPMQKVADAQDTSMNGSFATVVVLLQDPPL
jgi:hypothetical protein